MVLSKRQLIFSCLAEKGPYRSVSFPWITQSISDRKGVYWRLPPNRLSRKAKLALNIRTQNVPLAVLGSRKRIPRKLLLSSRNAQLSCLKRKMRITNWCFSPIQNQSSRLQTIHCNFKMATAQSNRHASFYHVRNVRQGWQRCHRFWGVYQSISDLWWKSCRFAPPINRIRAHSWTTPKQRIIPSSQSQDNLKWANNLSYLQSDGEHHLFMIFFILFIAFLLFQLPQSNLIQLNLYNLFVKSNETCAPNWEK